MIRRLAAQALLSAILRVPSRGLRSRAVLRGLRMLRALLIGLGDPLVQYDLAGTRIVLPLSHDLPITKKFLPYYSTNVARIARYVAETYPEFVFVDIGANVGDTAALVRSEVDAPILCIEGDERWFSILELNAVRIGKQVEIERAFVGDETGGMSVRIEERRSTTHLVAQAEAPEIQTVRLSEALERRPVFARAKMIKLDTDGFDCRIIRGALRLLTDLRCVLFFEYDPHWLGLAGDRGIDVFAKLREVGYEWAIFYEKSGEYLISVRLEDQWAIEDLDGYYRGQGGDRYADVCVFHRDDVGLWETVRRRELEFFTGPHGSNV
jgi:FkbM family methyltransferase